MANRYLLRLHHAPQRALKRRRSWMHLLLGLKWTPPDTNPCSPSAPLHGGGAPQWHQSLQQDKACKAAQELPEERDKELKALTRPQNNPDPNLLERPGGSCQSMDAIWKNCCEGVYFAWNNAGVGFMGQVPRLPTWTLNCSYDQFNWFNLSMVLLADWCMCLQAHENICRFCKQG